MSRSQREKGKRGERMAVEELRRVFPDAKRKVVNHAGTENGVDLESTGEFRVQVKNRKTYAPVTALFEVQDKTGIPLLLTKAERREWLAVMRLDDLLNLLAKLQAYDKMNHNLCTGDEQ